MMNGAAGNTYGANGIWQLNRRGQPHGASPNGTGNGYGVITWDEAMRLSGSGQVAFGKRFLESLPWTDLRPMPETAAWADAEQTRLGDWIWFPEGDPKRDAPVEARFFRRAFDLPQKQIRRAVLRIAADDRFTAWVNGKQVGSSANWQAPARIDATGVLKPGANLLAVRAENLKAPVKLNPAGLNAALKVDFTDDTRISVVTDLAWRASKTEVPNWRDSAFDDSKWLAAIVTAKFGEAPWGQVAAENPLLGPQGCGIADRLRVVYALEARSVIVSSLGSNSKYSVTRFDPVTGMRTAEGEVKTTPSGTAQFAAPSHAHDWVLFLERADGAGKE